MYNSLSFFSFNTKHLHKPHDWQFGEFQVHECPVWWDGIERTTFTKFTTLRQHFSLRFAFQRTAKCVLVFVQGVSHFPPYPLHPEQYPMHEHHAGLSPIVHDLTPNCWHSWAFYGTRESTMREKECVKGGQKEASEITRPGWLNYGRKKANQEEARIALMARLLFLSAVNCYCFWGITVFMELASSFYPSFFLSFSVIHLPSFDTLKLLEEALFFMATVHIVFENIVCQNILTQLLHILKLCGFSLYCPEISRHILCILHLKYGICLYCNQILCKFRTCASSGGMTPAASNDWS